MTAWRTDAFAGQSSLCLLRRLHGGAVFGLQNLHVRCQAGQPPRATVNESLRVAVLILYTMIFAWAAALKEHMDTRTAPVPMRAVRGEKMLVG